MSLSQPLTTDAVAVFEQGVKPIPVDHYPIVEQVVLFVGGVCGSVASAGQGDDLTIEFADPRITAVDLLGHSYEVMLVPDLDRGDPRLARTTGVVARTHSGVGKVCDAAVVSVTKRLFSHATSRQ